MTPLFDIPEVTIKAPSGEVTLTIQHIPGKQFIYANWTWQHSQGIDMVYEGCEAVLQFMKEKKAKGILNDNRFCKDSWDEASEWIANDWTPRAIAGGLLFFSFILSEDIFSQLSAEELQQQVAGFTMRSHGSGEEALAWLEESLAQEG